MSENENTEKDIIRKDDLVTLLASRANFYKKDIYKIVNALTEILAEAIESEKEIRVKGLFNLTYTWIKPERFHNVLTGEWEEGSAYRRATLRLARQLRDYAITDPTKRKIYQTRQAELRRSGELVDDEIDDLEDEMDAE
jgi:nucleoid DNA-binding protein